MKLIAVSQRVDVIPSRHERRDALDQAWLDFLARCGGVPVPMPNRVDLAVSLLRGLPFMGALLTGGNDIGGDAPERDATERALIDETARIGLPLVGVCRGMQMIQGTYGLTLRRVSQHAGQHHGATIDGRVVEVNSFHQWGTCDSVPALDVWARATDGVVEGVRDLTARRLGLMWHPERGEPRAEDVALIRDWFGLETERCAR